MLNVLVPTSHNRAREPLSNAASIKNVELPVETITCVEGYVSIDAHS